MSRNEDGVLLERCQDGDREALRALYDRSAPGLLRFLERTLLDPGLAEDVCQEAFLRIWRRAELFDPERGSFSAWLYRIAANLAYNRLAVKSFHEATLDGTEELRPAQQPDPLEHASASERRRALHEALGELKPQDRAILTLRHLEERSIAEIAAIFEIPEGTVKSRVHYALHRLKDLVEHRLGTAEGAMG